jgi:hypothetical protein
LDLVQEVVGVLQAKSVLERILHETALRNAQALCFFLDPRRKRRVEPHGKGRFRLLSIVVLHAYIMTLDKAVSTSPADLAI